MSECPGWIRDALPDVVAGRAPAEVCGRVLAHAEDCADCAGELDLLKALHAGRPVLPRELAEGIGRGVRAGVADRALPGSSRTRHMRVPAWALAAAAVAVLALGTPSMVERMGGWDPAGSDGLDDLDPAGSLWISEDPLVAGAPVLESLTDEQLAQLLEEMDG